MFVNSNSNPTPDPTAFALTSASRWILERFQQLEQVLDQAEQNFELARSVEALYNFLWNDLADWYVEYLKTDDTQIGFAKELFKQFTITASPYMPFEAEALWQDFFGEEDLLAFELKNPNWSHQVCQNNPNIQSKEFANVIEIITKIRSMRGLFAIDPAQKLEVFTTQTELQAYQAFFQLVAKTELKFEPKTDLYTFEVDGQAFSLDILNYIKDKQSEIQRTNKLIESLNKQIQALQSQLHNQNFLQNAEKAVIAEKKSDLRKRQEELEAQTAKLKFLD
jgi:valyl-tRNA synthetase